MNLTRSRFLLIALLSLVTVLHSCNPSRNTVSSDSRSGRLEETSRILFLDYMLERDSATATYDAQLISMLIREGKIKESRTNSGPPVAGDLELLVQDQNEHTLIHKHIPNPLDRSVEYVNDAGHFEHLMIHLDSAQFSIRLQIEPGSSSILLNRFTGDEPEAMLLLKTTIL